MDNLTHRRAEDTVTDRPALQQIDLTHDELAFILTLFGLSTVGDYHVPPDFDEGRALAAGNSLIGRGLTVLTDEAPAVHPDVVALITSSVTYSVALGLNLPPNAQAGRVWYYIRPERIICQRRIDAHMEHFEVIPNAVGLAADLQQTLIAAAGTPGELPFSVPKALLSEAEAIYVAYSPADGHRLLISAGLPATFAENVFDPLHQIIAVLIRLSQADDGAYQTSQNTIMLIEAGQGFWLLEEDPTNPEWLRARPLDSFGTIEHLVHLVGF